MNKFTGCKCGEWKEYIEYMVKTKNFIEIHHGKLNILPFVYCPYCKRKLKKI